jgi:N utilization substance protein A
LAGERVDIVRWDPDPRVFICNALQPAEIGDVILDAAESRATVVVRDDQKSLAVGRRGQNQSLASELCGYNIEVVTLEP